MRLRGSCLVPGQRIQRSSIPRRLLRHSPWLGFSVIRTPSDCQRCGVLLKSHPMPERTGTAGSNWSIRGGNGERRDWRHFGAIWLLSLLSGSTVTQRSLTETGNCVLLDSTALLLLWSAHISDYSAPPHKPDGLLCQMAFGGCCSVPLLYSYSLIKPSHTGSCGHNPLFTVCN